MRRDPFLARSAVKRDGMCLRCFVTGGELHAHHRRPLADGGEDSLENLTTLCRSCHLEWHRHAEGLVPFGEFLDIPPLRVLYSLWANEDHEQLSLLDMRSLWMLNKLERVGIARRTNGYAWLS